MIRHQEDSFIVFTSS